VYERRRRSARTIITWAGTDAATGGPSWYDAGRFWSGDRLDLTNGFRLGTEIAVDTISDLQ
jgi:hypothetical protein